MNSCRALINYLHPVKLFTIPNIITLLNLACGCLAIVFAFNGNLVWSAYLVGIAAVLDFLDGFVARALKQYSPIGKDLDSLADMVTFGVVPGVVMFQMMTFGVRYLEVGRPDSWIMYLPFFAFSITLFSALRLAKFNNDTRQSDSFMGVPTPANSILICSLPLIASHELGITNFAVNLDSGWMCLTGVSEEALSSWQAIMQNSLWVLLSLVVIMSYLLIAELQLFSLKFKFFKWKGNEIRYSFLAASVVMLVLLKYIALPLIILLYILLSIVNNLLTRKTHAGQP